MLKVVGYLHSSWPTVQLFALTRLQFHQSLVRCRLRRGARQTWHSINFYMSCNLICTISYCKSCNEAINHYCEQISATFLIGVLCMCTHFVGGFFFRSADGASKRGTEIVIIWRIPEESESQWPSLVYSHNGSPRESMALMSLAIKMSLSPPVFILPLSWNS